MSLADKARAAALRAAARAGPEGTRHLTLSPHFTLEELTRSDTAVRLGIDNAAPQDVVPHLLVLAQGLEDVRLLLGNAVHVLSGYRCEELERVLCAKDFAAWCSRRSNARGEIAWCEYFKAKAHPRGYAGDIVVPGFGAPIQVARVLNGSGIKFDQLILEGSWAHISFDPCLRGQVLTATFNGGTPTYSNGVS